MKSLAIILLYLLGTVLLGALLAPPLFWAGQAIAARGVLSFLGETEFQKYWNRAMLVAAVLLFWPVVRALGIRHVRQLGVVRDPRRWQHLAAGFLIAGLFVAAMAVTFVEFGIYRWKAELPWGKVGKIALSATAVALLEELLFRGAIFGLLKRTLRPYVAMFLTTFLFAIVHFLKPDDRVTVNPVDWLSGFVLLPHAFHQFAAPMMLAAGFSTLFCLGWLFGYARLRTGALWMSIGLHAGIVFVKMTFSKFTKREEEILPWIGPELQIGLVPVGVLLLAIGAVWWWLNHVEHYHPPRD